MDFNLRVHSAGLLLCRFNRFSVMKKQIAVGGLRSLHVTSKVGGPHAWLRLPPGLRRAVGKPGGRWRGGRAAVSLSVGWAPRPGSVGKGFQPSPLRHVHLQPPAPSCPPASSPVVPARPSVTALGARSSGFSAAQSSGVQVWGLLLSGPLGQGLAACGLNGAGL